jgi:hypothetical protein
MAVTRNLDVMHFRDTGSLPDAASAFPAYHFSGLYFASQTHS